MEEIKVKVIWDDNSTIPELIEENKLEFGRAGKIKFHIIGERTEILMV